MERIGNIMPRVWKDLFPDRPYPVPPSERPGLPLRIVKDESEVFTDPMEYLDHDGDADAA